MNEKRRSSRRISELEARIKYLEQMVADRTQTLQYQLKFENLISSVLTTFINIPPADIHSVIQDALASIADFAGAENYFISYFEECEEPDDCETCTVYSGDTSSTGKFSVIKNVEFHHLFKHTADKEWLYIPDISQLPGASPKEKKFFQVNGIKSVIIVPMVSESSHAGFFGFGFKGTKGSKARDIGALLIIVRKVFISALNRVKTEVALQRSREQLRHAQKMEALGQLAGGVAHDFNNILTSIIIASEVSLSTPGLHDSISEKFQEILKSAERGSNLTRQLLAISRKQVIKPRLLDVGNIIFELNRMLSRLIRRDIEILLEPGRDLPPIKADPGQVEQVLINLAVNARDAICDNPVAGAEKKIHISISKIELGDNEVSQNIIPRPGNYIRIQVSDTGMGMEKEILNRVFEPFFTTKNEGKGTGLGLATVYGIVKQNEGGITVESEPGKGTVFNVFWPTVETAASEMEKPAAAKFQMGGDETILLVEDDDTVRMAMEEYLLAVGYTVLTAPNGKVAMEIVEQLEQDGGRRVQLLLTDVMMPVMNGRELADVIKKRLPGIKIIFTTGYSDDPLSITESLQPDSRFIQKPYSVKELSKLIRELLDTG